MKKIYGSFGLNVIREDRIEGVVVTYRPGDARPTWGVVNAGDPLVLLLLKSGKPGKKVELYQGLTGETEWLPA